MKTKTKTLKSTPKKTSSKSELVQLRKEIAALDKAFLDVFRHYLTRREALAKIVGSIKTGSGLAIRDPKIETTVLGQFKRAAGKTLGEKAALMIGKTVLAASRKTQAKTRR